MADINSNETFDRRPQEKKSKAVPILAILLGASVIFASLQTVYIIALNSGLKGNMTYLSGRDKDDDGDDEGGKKSSDTEKNDNPNMGLPDPHFSLEEAASVHDPDKTTLSTMEIVDKVSPATVSVFITSKINGYEQKISSGSGFIISDNGYMITNDHVVSAAVDNPDYSIQVVVPGIDHNITAKVIGSDEQTDIAVLQLEEERQYNYVTLGDSTTLRPGELAVVIGNALGTFEGTVTVGVISALDRNVNNKGYTMTLIQTDASINSGNSGGPLINSFGEVVGVTNAKIASAEGMGFAIPISEVKDEIESIIQNGYVADRPYLGITVATITEESYYGATPGVYVAEIAEGGPGDKAGLQVGDRFITMDGEKVEESSDILRIRDGHKVGDSVTVKVDRDGKTKELDLIIGDGVNS